MDKKTKEQQWILIRDCEPNGIFKNRKEAVKHFKETLKQVLKDFENQDKSDEFDYPIKIPEIEYKPLKERESYLGF